MSFLAVIFLTITGKSPDIGMESLHLVSPTVGWIVRTIVLVVFTDIHVSLKMCMLSLILNYSPTFTAKYHNR